MKAKRRLHWVDTPHPEHNTPSPSRKGADVVPIGGSIRLVSVDSLARELGLTLAQTDDILLDMGVPLFELPTGRSYFDLWSLEVALRLALMPAGSGYPTSAKQVNERSVLTAVNLLLNKISRFYGQRVRAALKQRCQFLAKKIHQQLQKDLQKYSQVDSQVTAEDKL